MAETKTWHGFRYKTDPDWDGWTVSHAALGASSYIAARVVGVKPKYALITACAVGLLKEVIVDGYNNPVPFDEGDPGGADFLSDFPITCFGGAIACVTEGMLKFMALIPKKDGFEVAVILEF